jgi:hypothetical protein
MPFTTEEFLGGAAQTTQTAPREPSYSLGDDGCLEHLSLTSPSSMMPLEYEEEKECRISCGHRDCRTFRPAHGEALPAYNPRRPTSLPRNSIIAIFYLHKKLASLQESADACVQMFNLCESGEAYWTSGSAIIRSYYRNASRRCWAFEALLKEIRGKHAYFGHIDMPERVEFSDAVEISGLSPEQVSFAQLLDWDSRAEALRKETRNNSEVQYEKDDYLQAREILFRSGWNFATSNAEGEGMAIEDDQIAPDETIEENRGMKRSRSKSSNISDETMGMVRMPVE